jgi:predicted O-methyltransferase YrrM
MLKNIAAHMPGVRDLISTRDGLLRERGELVRERGELVRERGELVRERDDLLRIRDELIRGQRFVPPGHFYSPIPSLDDVALDEARLFAPPPREIPGIDLREAEQLALLDRLQSYYPAGVFPEQKAAGFRYYFENQAYEYSDAVFYHMMIRYLKPKRIIEVGSGYSSCMALDTNELFLGNTVACTFIEPYPDVLLSLVSGEDRERVEVIATRLQDVSLERFAALEENDILFVDSTHVSKIGSDVNHIFFEIMPLLRPGVYVHFHDIFYPFEYLRDWIYEGRAWNEAYLLRAFLTLNTSFEIVLFNTFLERFHRERFARQMPLCLRNEGGSIWIRKIQ